MDSESSIEQIDFSKACSLMRRKDVYSVMLAHKNEGDNKTSYEIEVTPYADLTLGILNEDIMVSATYNVGVFVAKSLMNHCIQIDEGTWYMLPRLNVEYKNAT